MKCYIPFHGLTIDPTGNVIYCCVDKPNPQVNAHIDDIDDLEEYWKSNRKDVWAAFESNKQHLHNPCNQCYDENGVKDYTVADIYGNMVRNNYINWHEDKDKLRYLEWTTSNICNQMCVMCSSRYSTIWQKYDEEFGREVYPTTQLSNSAIDKIKKLVPNLEYVVIKGGEPFADMKNMALLEYMGKTNSNCKINIVSNLQGITQRHIDILKTLPNLDLNASIDGIGREYDWIRGGNFDRTIDNMKSIYEQTGIKTTVIVTISVYNFHSLEKILDFFYNKEYCKFITMYNVVQSPEWCNPRFLDENDIEETLFWLRKYDLKLHKKHDFGNLLNMTPMRPREGHWEKWTEYTNKINNIRGFEISW